ncbi:MAG: hypothetical protein K5756_05555 [Clostridiales bacterium]|nr:hypothetical protein [Clostridiales bacterium]
MNFSQNELNYMREQAVKKAFEMQKRSKKGLDEPTGEIIFEKTAEPRPAKNDYVNAVLKNNSRSELIKAKVPFSNQRNGEENNREGIQTDAGYDDRLLILALVIILTENNADRLLILALLYIMM